jgi:hypothetical protein
MLELARKACDPSKQLSRPEMYRLRVLLARFGQDTAPDGSIPLSDRIRQLGRSAEVAPAFQS